MYNESDIAKLEFVAQILDDAYLILKRYASIHDALCDIEGKNALLMIILQVGEKLNKIKDQELAKKLPIKSSYYVRNRITHDYDGIDYELIESIIEIELPKIQASISEILEDKKTNN